MKKIGIILAGVISLLFSPALFAAQTPSIRLYAMPNTRKLIETLPGNAALVPIYQQKKWVKVGDPRNGKVGWVNKQQWRDARTAFFRPDIQTVYIHSDRNKKGKPALNIVAYKNGKALSAEQAKRLYRKIRQQQVHEARRMERLFGWIDRPFFQIERFPLEPSRVLPAEQQPSRQTHKTLES